MGHNTFIGGSLWEFGKEPVYSQWPWHSILGSIMSSEIGKEGTVC